MALQKFKVVNETLDKKPLETTENVVNFLNTMNYVDKKDIGIKYRTTIIIWVRKILGKHNNVKNVHDKVDQMLLQNKGFKN